MIYVVKKNRHYLLGDNFIFFVDHQTLLYLVNEPIVIGKLLGGFYYYKSLILKWFTNPKKSFIARSFIKD
jgi:hypothetical protein